MTMKGLVDPLELQIVEMLCSVRQARVVCRLGVTVFHAETCTCILYEGLR